MDNIESLLLVSKDGKIIPVKSSGWDLITK